MYENIMKEYKKTSLDRNFNVFYWCSAIVIALISFLFKCSFLFIFISLIIVNLVYALFHYFKIIKNTKKEKRF